MIEYLVLKDFKSYKGIQKIGPFLRFTAIIGPNGSGKSNIMDAICFVLGVDTFLTIRSDKLKDLIFFEQEKSSEQIGSFVEIIYRKDSDNLTTSFKRTIFYSKKIKNFTSEYLIDNSVVSYQAYSDTFETLGIPSPATLKNFLIFQGDVASISLYTRYDLTTLFENLSGSIIYKKKYEELKNLIETCENSLNLLFERKKALLKEKRNFKDLQNSNEKFENLILLQLETKIQYYLWQLYQLELDIQENYKNIKILENEEFVKFQKKIETIENLLNDLLKKRSNTHKNFLNLEKKLNEQRKEHEKNETEFLKLNLKKNHNSEILQENLKNKEKLKSKIEFTDTEIKKFNKELEILNNSKNKFEKETKEKEKKIFRL